MEALHELENSIAGLSADNYKKFRDWFWEYEQQKWDAKIEADLVDKKLDIFANAALQNFKEGKFSKL